jgi:hypothetical protein
MALAADICAALIGVCWEGTAPSSASAKVGLVGRGGHPSNESHFSYFVNKEENGTEEEEEEEEESTAFNSVGSFPVSLSEGSTLESYHLEGKYREKKMLV